MMTPPRFMSGIIARHAMNTPLAFTPIRVSQSSSLVSRRVFSIWIPALFTRISSPPKRSSISMRRSSMSSAEETSVWRQPRVGGRSWGRSPRPQVATSAPSATKASTMARPIPWRPPVTSAARPSSRLMRHAPAECKSRSARIFVVAG